MARRLGGVAGSIALAMGLSALAPNLAAAQTQRSPDPRYLHVAPGSDPRGTQDRRANDPRVRVPQSYRSPYPEPLNPYYGPYQGSPSPGGRVQRRR